MKSLLTRPASKILLALYEERELCTKEIIRKTGLQGQTVYKYLSGMHEDHLIEQEVKMVNLNVKHKWDDEHKMSVKRTYYRLSEKGKLVSMALFNPDTLLSYFKKEEIAV